MTWGHVAWGHVAWGHVAWDRVAWSHVAWDRVAWDRVAWGHVAWGHGMGSRGVGLIPVMLRHGSTGRQVRIPLSFTSGPVVRVRIPLSLTSGSCPPLTRPRGSGCSGLQAAYKASACTGSINSSSTPCMTCMHARAVGRERQTCACACALRIPMSRVACVRVPCYHTSHAHAHPCACSHVHTHDTGSRPTQRITADHTHAHRRMQEQFTPLRSSSHLHGRSILLERAHIVQRRCVHDRIV